MQILVVGDGFENGSQTFISYLVLYQLNQTELLTGFPYEIEYLLEVVVFDLEAKQL